MKKRRQIVVILIAIILLSVILVPYAYVEIHTMIWGEEFKDGYKQTNMIDNVKYHKVFSANEQRAKVYYVSEDTGDFVYFIKKDGAWQMEHWDTVWSKKGSADGITFPFYR